MAADSASPPGGPPTRTPAARMWRRVMCSPPKISEFYGGSGVAGMISENVARRPDRALREARKPEGGQIERRLAVHDDLRDEAAGDRPHGEAMAAEARGQHEASELRDFAEHGHQVGRGVDVAGPTARDPERRQRRQHAL